MKVLLTGGSGFIAAHCIDVLLEHNHSVVTTVRSDQKGQKILDAHPNVPKDRLSYVIVEDISQKGAFDKAVKSDPPFEAVLHTASPFHHKFDKPEELFEPAIQGTTGILTAIKAYAPEVKRVVITSSFAAVINPKQHKETYDESVWNPVTYEEGVEQRSETYRASKTLAEKAAWSFVEHEKPNFTLATINPPIVFGPIVHYLNSLDAINTSNERILNLMRGKWKEQIPPSGVFIWVDVRDVALAHVRAAEVEEAANKRFLVTAGHYAHAEIAELVKKDFPEYASKLPEKIESDKSPSVYGYDNSRSKKVLDLQYMPLEKSIGDTIRSLKALGA